VLCGIAAGDAKHIATAAPREELGGRSYKRARQLRAQAPDKCLLKEEVAERRGASAKRSLSEEGKIDQQRKRNPPIHPFIHPSLCSVVHWFIGS